MADRLRLRQIELLAPERDSYQIYRLHALYEFPWDVTRALELALYRTYAIPSIGDLLDRTGQFRNHAQKRYDDTALLLAEVLQHGFTSDRGRAAIRRINRVHARFEISNEDYLYVLSTFVVVPLRWLALYGWRPVHEHERLATHGYYRHLGRRMGIQGIPEDIQDLFDLHDTYEREHLAYSAASRRTGEATRELFVSWVPRPLAPLARHSVHALLDPPLLRAFDFAPAPAVLRTGIDRGLRLRAAVERRLPPRRKPVLLAERPTVSYPQGYRIDELGPAATG